MGVSASLMEYRGRKKSGSLPPLVKTLQIIPRRHVCTVGSLVMIFTSPAGAVAKYCDEYVCLCVCLSTRISPEPHARSLGYQIFVHVAFVRGSVLRHVDDRPHRLSAGRG